MPQRDDKVGIHFGRISWQCWESLGERPGAIVEQAVPLLARALKEGRKITYPATLRKGMTKKLWLKPTTAALLQRMSDETGMRKTPIILAALAIYWETHPPSESAGHPVQRPTGER